MEFLRLCVVSVIGVLLTTGLALAAEGPATTAARRTPKPFFRRPWLLGAHRGGAALWPENTLVAFKAAAKRWPDIVLETDAWLTADGHVVLLHDGTVDRTTDGRGPVSRMTLAEVKKLDAGCRFTRDRGATFPHRGKGVQIPTLGEALAAAPDSRFEIELKPSPGVVEPALRAIRQAKAEDRVLLASFDPRLIHEVRRLAPRIAACYGFGDGLVMLDKLRKGGEAWASYRPAADVLSLMQRMLKQFNLRSEQIQAIRAKGIYLQFHTPNSRESIERMLNLNPDSVLTDHPDLLAEIIAERAKSK